MIFQLFGVTGDWHVKDIFKMPFLQLDSNLKPLLKNLQWFFFVFFMT